MTSALIVFAKVPEPGNVKTRLTPVLTPDEAARLYRAFLLDALAQYTALDVPNLDVRLYLSPPLPDDLDRALGGEAMDEPAIPDGVEVFAQSGDGLGARMATAFDETFAAGYDRACVIGTDHPTLPSSFVRQGVRAVASDRSICVGPSADGGYYLLGMSRFYPQVFREMTYSHPKVFSRTLSRVEETNASLTVLPRWYDVDDPETLRRLLDDLDGTPVDAANTRRVVEELGLHELRTT